jgi:small subunit ribosomal protein S2
MSQVTMKQLLEAGVHFGHQTSRWNPKMRPYIFGARNGIHIIDLQQTVTLFRAACDIIKDVAVGGGNLLFVGTKKQAQEPVKIEAERCGQSYVNARWLGGTLTNFQTIKLSIERLKKVEEQLEDDAAMSLLKKKEILMLQRECDKLKANLQGVRDMKRLPDAMFVIDPDREQIAVHEANRLGIPVIAVVDTNCDPDNISHCIPGNDDAIRAIRLFCSAIADSVLEGRQERDERAKGAGDIAAEFGVTATPAEPAEAAGDGAAEPTAATAETAAAAPQTAPPAAGAPETAAPEAAAPEAATSEAEAEAEAAKAEPTTPSGSTQ